MKTSFYGLGVLPGRFAYVPDEKTYMRLMRKFQVPKSEWGGWLGDNAAAVTHTLLCDKGEPKILVCFPREDARRTSAQAALMAHEAVHVVASSMQFMQEKSPGEEVVAYSVQYVTQALLDELWAEPMHESWDE